MRSKWILKDSSLDYSKIAKEYNVSHTVAKILANRQIEDVNMYLYGTLDDLHSPSLLPNIDEAVSILHKKIEEKKLIRIVGDYDVDGVMSTFVLYKGLSSFGANVDYVVPHRIKDGYGININLIDDAYNDGVDTIITCDNGISAYTPIEHAKFLGMTVIVTDHHEIPFEVTDDEKSYIIPRADVVIDPKLPECNYPFKEICGAFVAYKLIQHYIDSYWLDNKILDVLLEAVTMATVADVMPLINENRIIVKYGLTKIRNSSILGLQALIDVNEIDMNNFNTYTIGFVLAPCVNATGRLDSAKNAIELLLTDDRYTANKYAQMLKEMNDERKELTKQGVDKALEMIETTELKNDKVLVVPLEDCHESIAGIIAGRIREKYDKPVYVLTKTEEGFFKGSGRSIEEYNMYDEMNKCKEFLLKFGGHKMASGVSLEESNIDNFRNRLNDNCTLTENDFIPKVQIDMMLPLQQNTIEFIESLSVLEPYGVANPKPVFEVNNVRMINGKVLGKNKNVGKFTIKDNKENEYVMMQFDDIGKMNTYLASKSTKDDVKDMYKGKTELKIDIAYQPDINEFRGNRNVQIIMKDYR